VSAGCKSPASFFTLSWDKELARTPYTRSSQNSSSTHSGE
jgi:hypothetical protein